VNAIWHATKKNGDRCHKREKFPERVLDAQANFQRKPQQQQRDSDVRHIRRPDKP
jgi:hypothetical protein